MNLFRVRSAIGLFAVSALVGIALIGCASDPFSAKNLPATVQAGCNLVAASNQTFQTYAAAHPGKIDANGMATEGSIVDSVGLDVAGKAAPIAGTVCDPNSVPTLAVAETTLLRATLNIANLLSTWIK